MKTKTKKTDTNAITSLPPSPDEERHGRMVRYLISMGIRMICIIVVFIVPGWWALAPAIGAVVLPYVAVVLANAGKDGPGGQVERPGGIEVYRPQATPSSAFPSGEEAFPNGYARPAGTSSSAAGWSYPDEGDDASSKDSGSFTAGPAAPDSRS